jgi:hypothetical protein
MTEKTRVVFFDILRIVFICAIVFFHYELSIIKDFVSPLYQEGYIFFVYPESFALLAVYGLILVSGAVLELNYTGKINTIKEYIKFIYRRCARLYPTYWLSLILGFEMVLAILPSFIEIYNESFLGMAIEFTGFYPFFGLGLQWLNQMGWFIGTIVSLYFLYPFISSALKKNPYLYIILFAGLSWISRYYLQYYVDDWVLGYRIFPLCNLFEFALGILIVQKIWYPSTTKQYPTIYKISDLTFYIFITHMLIIQHIRIDVLIQNIFPYSQTDILAVTFWYGLVIVEYFVIAYLFMRVDKGVFQPIIRGTKNVT